jgi:hypothetical protein
VKTCENVAPNFGENRLGWFTMTTPYLKLTFLASSFWRKTKWLSLQPPYSLDLASCDFFLFPKMKLKLKGRRFETIEESQAESQRVFDTDKK